MYGIRYPQNSISLSSIIFDSHTPRQGIMPCHGFLFSLPRCGTEYVRTARHSRLIPCSTLSHCSIPRTPLRLPCSPAEVSLSPGASRQPANAAPCRECRSYFPFFYYDSSFHLHQSPATYLSAGKYFPAKLSPHHLPMFRMFCVLTY